MTIIIKAMKNNKHSKSNNSNSNNDDNNKSFSNGNSYVLLTQTFLELEFYNYGLAKLQCLKFSGHCLIHGPINECSYDLSYFFSEEY